MTTELQPPEAATDFHSDLLPTQLGPDFQAWALENPPEAEEENPEAEEETQEPLAARRVKKTTAFLAVLTACLSVIVLLLGADLWQRDASTAPAPAAAPTPSPATSSHEKDLQFLARLSQIPHLEVLNPTAIIRDAHLRCQELEDGYSYSSVQDTLAGDPGIGIGLTPEQQRRVLQAAIETYCPQYSSTKPAGPTPPSTNG